MSTIPQIFHTLKTPGTSVLAIASDDAHIFTGSQHARILAWDKRTFILKTVLTGHTGSILALEYAADQKWLFSSSGDSTVRVWSTESMSALYVIEPYQFTASGDLYSLTWSAALRTLYIGCQDTSLQWYTFEKAGSPISRRTQHKAHKFFNSFPQSERRSAEIVDSSPELSLGLPDSCVIETPSQTEIVLNVSASNVIHSAHYGYLYSLALIKPPSPKSTSEPSTRERNTMLVSGSGDEDVKLWELLPEENGKPHFLHTFPCQQGAVLSLAVREDDIVFAGCQDGFVHALDLDTRSIVRVLPLAPGEDVTALSVVQKEVYAISATGSIHHWDSAFQKNVTWRGHEGIALSSIITRIPSSNADDTPRVWLITGANDDFVRIWQITTPLETSKQNSSSPLSPVIKWDSSSLIAPSQERLSWSISGESLLHALREFVAIPSISSVPSHREDCRQAAIWLKRCLSRFGASASVITLPQETNPLVIATFFGSPNPGKKTQRVLFYGHYDIVSAPSSSWESPPFKLSGRNGYLYGRGVTDNKGPILAVACAAKDLLARKELNCDLVMLIEGEEENGSLGFAEALRKHKHLIGTIDAILISNSTWIAEDMPCITYGMRGVIHSTISVTSSNPDVHSGVEGGAIAEPMIDLVKTLGSLTDPHRRVLIPDFYKDVQPQSAKEKELFTLLSSIIHESPSTLSSKWREPALSVHNVRVSGPQNSTVIPSRVEANISLRVVPKQNLGEISQSLIDHVKLFFKTLQSTNSVDITIDQSAAWWLGQLDDQWFKALERAITDEWGIEPLRIREGGSIPSVPFLEKEFQCHALHLPLGQSTGQAHLPNERMSLANLRRGKSVIERFLASIPHLDVS